MPEPSRRRRRASTTGSLPIRVTSLRFNPADASLLAGALLLNATEHAARQQGAPRPFLAGHDRLADISNHTNREETTRHDHDTTDDD